MAFLSGCLPLAVKDIAAKLKAGTITKVEVPTEWLAGAFWVEKPGKPGQLWKKKIKMKSQVQGYFARWTPRLPIYNASWQEPNKIISI